MFISPSLIFSKFLQSIMVTKDGIDVSSNLTVVALICLLMALYIYIIMWLCPGNMSFRPGYKGRVICLADLGNILAYYLDKTTLILLLY